MSILAPRPCCWIESHGPGHRDVNYAQYPGVPLGPFLTAHWPAGLRAVAGELAVAGEALRSGRGLTQSLAERIRSDDMSCGATAYNDRTRPCHLLRMHDHFDEARRAGGVDILRPSHEAMALVAADVLVRLLCRDGVLVCHRTRRHKRGLVRLRPDRLETWLAPRLILLADVRGLA